MNVIETPRLIVRQLEQDDLAALHRIMSDPVTMSFWPAPFTLEQTQGWIDRSLRSYQEHGFGRYAMVSKAGQALIGDCGFWRLELDGAIENDLGYIVYRDFWRQGFAVEAAEACLRYAVETLGLRRVCANMAFDHVGSRRVAEKIGMRREREFVNRRNRDILTYLYAYDVEQPAQGDDERTTP